MILGGMVCRCLEGSSRVYGSDERLNDAMLVQVGVMEPKIVGLNVGTIYAATVDTLNQYMYHCGSYQKLASSPEEDLAFEEKDVERKLFHS